MSKPMRLPAAKVTARNLLLVGIFAGLIGGILAWLTVGTDYTATASVLVRPVTAQPFATADASKLLSMGTEVRIARSANLDSKVATETGLAAETSPNLSVTNPAETLLLNFSYTSPDPEVAADAANAFAAGYLTDRQRRTAATVDTVGKALDAELAAVNKQLAKKSKSLGGASAAQRELLRAEIASLISQSVAIKAKQIEIQSLDVTPGELVARAVPPSEPGTPSLLVWVILGATAGLSFGILLIWLRPAYEPYLVRRSEGLQPIRARAADRTNCNVEDAQ